MQFLNLSRIDRFFTHRTGASIPFGYIGRRSVFG